MPRTPLAIVSALFVAAGASTALGDNWTMTLTADNFFNAYFGTPTQTTSYVGGGGWPIASTFNPTNVPSTDTLYVQCHSDYGTAQGFLGTFTNTTTNVMVNTDLTNWQVFPAGAHLAALGYPFPSWPAFQTPTQAQVDAAINYATTNGLWITPSTFAPYNNTNGSPSWGPVAGISPSAQWIWHNANNSPNPLNGGFNHDEFLIFRYQGIVPAPAGLGVFGAAGLLAGRRRRR
ncbi:MAG: hypothetical protein H6809_07385 [Phycisphaeraceae bacterium]|nr:hypothetical protein [Phycisphaeraceae bacterium]